MREVKQLSQGHKGGDPAVNLSGGLASGHCPSLPLLSPLPPPQLKQLLLSRDDSPSSLRGLRQEHTCLGRAWWRSFQWEGRSHVGQAQLWRVR